MLLIHYFAVESVNWRCSVEKCRENVCLTVSRAMSPASSGPIEVERYIGACLISNQSRHKANSKRIQDNYHHQRSSDAYQTFPDRWAGGVPLISYANQRWSRQENQEQKGPISHLVVHAQGAPLILTSRYGNRTNKSKNNRKNSELNENCKIQESKENIKNISPNTDTVSVASDESTGSGNVETCLPRIIKPRKRRKKDRKPPHILTRPLSQDGSYSPDVGSPEIDSTPQSPLFSYMSNFRPPFPENCGPPNHEYRQVQPHHFQLRSNQPNCVINNKSSKYDFSQNNNLDNFVETSNSNEYFHNHNGYNSNNNMYRKYNTLQNHYFPSSNCSSDYHGKQLGYSDVNLETGQNVYSDNRLDNRANFEKSKSVNGTRIINSMVIYNSSTSRHNDTRKSSKDCYKFEHDGAVSEISETPKLHHSFEEVVEPIETKDINGNASSCHCKYCDPSSQIWDIDRNCFSPYLTNPVRLGKEHNARKYLGKNAERNFFGFLGHSPETIQRPSLEENIQPSTFQSFNALDSCAMSQESKLFAMNKINFESSFNQSFSIDPNQLPFNNRVIQDNNKSYQQVNGDISSKLYHDGMSSFTEEDSGNSTASSPRSSRDLDSTRFVVSEDSSEHSDSSLEDSGFISSGTESVFNKSSRLFLANCDKGVFEDVNNRDGGAFNVGIIGASESSSSFNSSDSSFFNYSPHGSLRNPVSFDNNMTIGQKRPTGDLKVSTEIVTSVNGHRDLEIKFFSSLNLKDEESNAKTYISKTCRVKKYR